MNIENIDKAIAVMKRVEAKYPKHFNMEYFQGPIKSYLDDWKNAEREEDLKDCGTACCFSGWLGIAPEFADIANKDNRLGFRIDDLHPVESLAKLFDISVKTAENIIYFDMDNENMWGKFDLNLDAPVGKAIKPWMIIDILERIKKGEIV